MASITASNEEQFVKRWMQEADERIIKVGMIVAAVYLVSILPFVSSTIHPQLVPFIFSVHAVLLVAIVAAGLYRHITGNSLALWAFSLCATSSFLMAYVNYSNFTLTRDIEVHWMSLMATLFVNGWIMLSLPTQFRGWQFLMPGFILIALASCVMGGVSAAALCVVVVFLACFSCIKFIGHRMLQNEGRRNFELQAAARQLERGRIDHELYLARKIQMSLLPPKQMTLTGGVELKFYSRPHEQVGGDWAAVRNLTSGETIVLIADACGKGIQAALVLHAIQSLWANALSSDFFDPRSWLQSVNSSLINLGKGEPHLATIGILSIGFDYVQYWSAGHLPCYLINGVGKVKDVKAIIARGNMVGLSEDFDLTPVICPFFRKLDTIILGSDGFFSGQPRVTREAVVSMAELLEERGEEVLTKECSDDQTAILLSPVSALERVA